MSKNTKSATVNKSIAKANKYVDLLSKSTDCIITFKEVTKADGKTLTDDIAKVVSTYKTSAWEFAKVCYFANKVKGIKVETLGMLFDVSFQNISKHANNVEYLLTTFGKGYDAYAEKYSVSKVDLIRKAKDKGCYKGVKFEDIIGKKRDDIERAINGKADTSADNKVDTVVIHMSDDDGNEISRHVDKTTWERWLKESKAE